MDEYTNYLAHFGIKGMHWGVRRYQNPDGSLTPAGRSKYGVGPKRKQNKTGSEKKAAKKAAKAAAARNKQILREKAARDRRMKTGPGAASEALKMPEKDVRELTSRYKAANDYMKERSQLDQYIDKYSPKQPSRGEKIVKNFERAAKVAESTAKVYTAYQKMFGTPKKDSDYYTTELKRLQVIQKKKDMGIKDSDTQAYAKKGKSTVTDIVKKSNDKINSLNKGSGSKKKGSGTSNAEKNAAMVQYIFNTTNYNNTLNGNVMKGDVYRNNSDRKRLNK